MSCRERSLSDPSLAGWHVAGWHATVAGWHVPSRRAALNPECGMPSLSEKSFKLMKKHAFCGSALGRLRLDRKRKICPTKNNGFPKNITVGRFKFQKIIFLVFQSKFPAKPKTKLFLFFGLKIKENESALETTIAPCCCGSGAWVMIVFSHRCAKSIGSPLRGASVAQHCLGWFRTCSSARLAQSAERKALNLVVVGSSPTVGVLPFPLGWRSF